MKKFNLLPMPVGILALTALLAVMLLPNASTAQLVYNQPFTIGPNVPPPAYPSTVLPMGWSQGKYGPSTSSINQWDVVDVGGNPFTFPRSNPTLMRFQSWSIPPGEASFLASKRLDMRNLSCSGTFNFWMYRNGGTFFDNYLDRIQVFVNDSAVVVPGSPSQALLTENISGLTTIHRSRTQTPVVGSNGWYNYSYNIPAGYNTANVYIMIVATSEFGENIFIDDFTVTSCPNAQNFVASSGMVVSQNVSTTAPNQINQQIIGMRIQMDGAASPRVLSNMAFNTNGSTNPVTDITNAKLWFSGGSDIFSTANAVLIGTYTPPHLTNYAFLTAPNAFYTGPASFNGLQHGDNYFWITYDIAPGAVSGNCVDAEWTGFSLISASPTAQVPNPQTLTGCRLIDVVYCQPTYYTGTAWLNYQTNDYIHGVVLVGDNVPAGGINSVNQRNTIYTAAGSNCAGAMPRLCPWQRHPPDYELFNSPAGPPFNLTNTTTQITADFMTDYPISLQVGTYGSGNAIAAWIDYNGDGVFNNYFDNTRKLCSGTAGNFTIQLATGVVTSGQRAYYGLNVGMTVYHPNIPAGTRITAINIGTNVVTLDNAVATTFTNVLGEFVNETPPMDRGEKVAQSGPMGSLVTHGNTFKVPNWASNFAGKRRMRVREVWINYNINPCSPYTYGETEDYTVTVIPDCPIFPGYKTWLGFTDDWSDPSNWCPVGAPIFGNPAANVRFPGGPTGGTYAYTKAKIASGVQARAMKFRVEAGDTVFIDAPAASDLIVTDSLIIWTPTSAIAINTVFTDSAQLQNGVLQNINLVPLKAALKTRSGWMFTQAEMLAQGLQNGDVIDSIKLHLRRNSNGNPYKNLKIKYYWTAPGNNFSSGNFPTISGLPATTTLIYSGDVDASAFVPVYQDWGTITLPLINAGIPYSTLNRKLVIDMSYDQTGFPLTGTSSPDWEDMRLTQTQADIHYVTYSTNSTSPAVPTAEILSYTMADEPKASSSITAGSNIVNVPNTTNLYEGMVAIAPGAIAGYFITAVGPGNTVTLSGNASATAAATTATFRHNFVRLTAIFRANMTFTWDRPYIKYPISVGGHWHNSGDFTSGRNVAGDYIAASDQAESRVTFIGPNSQRVEGSSITEFWDMTVNNNNHVSLFQDIIVNDSLYLQAGRLKLLNRLATLTNNEVGALTRLNGFIQSEQDVLANNIAPFGRLRWDMGAVLGLRQIPFVNASGIFIPMEYQPQVGTHDVTIATYATNAANINIPAPDVTNIFGFNGSAWNTDGSMVVDRYFMVDNTAGTAPTATMRFRYASTERIASYAPALPMSAQRWITSVVPNEWEWPFQPNQTYTTNISPGLDEVSIADFAGFGNSLWWTVVGTATPLPVSLLDFSAKPFKDKVQLKWTTASEFNSSHFVVERTVDNMDFSFIGRVESKGPSTGNIDYNTWDNNPVEGIQYYYLRQHDVDGRTESFGPVSAKFSRNLFDIITTTVSSSELGLTVVFNYDSDEPYSYRIVDMVGKLIVAKDRNPAEPGVNVIDIDAKLAKGAYQIILQNSEKMVARKFFY